MMSFFKISLAALMFCFYSSVVSANSFTPPKGKTILMTCCDRDTIANYVSATGDIPGGTMFYTSLQKVEGLDGPSDNGSGPMYGEALLKAYPNSVIHIALYLVDELNDTIAGTYDAHLKKLAQWIKKADRPVFLRIGYEFDNPENHYDPQKYKKAYRHVVDFMRKERVDNVAYVWHSQCVAYAAVNVMDWYPGDDYVDWFAVSIFSPQQISKAKGFLELARKHHKNFMIAESTPWGMYSIRGKIDWYNHMFQFIKENNVEAFCYVDADWDAQPMWKGQHIGDGRIEKYPGIKDLWLKEINQNNYLKASPELFGLLGWSKSKDNPS